MADPKACVQFVLRQEDARLAGTVTNIPGDRGGLTRFGLSAKFHPELVTQGFYEMAPDKALELADSAYEVCYERPLFLDKIESQPVANALLSFAVNEGNDEAIKLLQKACIGCGQAVSIDGKFGLGTLEAVNNSNPTRLLYLYCLYEEMFYRQLVQSNPEEQKFLDGWLNRVKADQQLA